MVFAREGDKYRFREDIQEQKTLAGRTPYNRLYLTVSNEWNNRHTEKAFLWFRTLQGSDNSGGEASASVKGGNGGKENVLREMDVADLGIVDMNYENWVLYPTHRVRGKDYKLPFERESDGTKKYFTHIGVWLDALEK